jgi:Flp pilus assembly protein TadG
MTNQVKKLLSNMIVKKKGNIAILSALFFTILIAFTGLAIDIGGMTLKRLHLLEIGHVIRDARFIDTVEIDNSNDPEATLNQLARNYAVKNGLESSQVSVDYYQTTLTQTQRNYELDIYLTDSYHCIFMNIFNIGTIPINVTIHGTSTATKTPRIWAPGR